MSPRPRARVYIDGFNVYYGALLGTPHKWVDFNALAMRLMPACSIEHITYCTARVQPSTEDPSVHVRQDVFFRALVAHCPNFELVEGHFKVGKVKGYRIAHDGCGCCATTPLTSCGCCGQIKAQVRKTEEKGSDVNLAVRLVSDGYQDLYDTALVLSDDSDLQPAVDIAMQQLGKTVVVCNPRYKRTWHSLNGTERRTLRPGALAACQLPNPVVAADGTTLSKPATW